MRYAVVLSSRARAPATVLERDLLKGLHQWLAQYTVTMTQAAPAAKQQQARNQALALMRTALTRAALPGCHLSHSTCLRLSQVAALSGTSGAVSDAWQHVMLALGANLFAFVHVDPARGLGSTDYLAKVGAPAHARHAGRAPAPASIQCLTQTQSCVAAHLLVALWPHLDAPAQAATKELLQQHALPGVPWQQSAQGPSCTSGAVRMPANTVLLGGSQLEIAL